MTHSIYPCLWFDGKAKAAAELYCSVFNNSKITAGSPMVVNFELSGQKFMGLNGGPMFKINPSISLFVSCKTVDAVNKIWEQLLKDGKILMPLDKYPWSERYGWVQDKFGVTWQLMVDEKANEETKITPSMLFTNKQFGRAEEAIHFYTSVFSGSSADKIIHYPPADANEGKVMYSEFKLNKYQLIAMDGPGAHDYSFNEAVSFVVNCDTQEEIDYYWNKFISDGGAESMCGWCMDKFGVSWQVIPSILGKLMSDPEKAPRVIEAFMQMKKFNIEKLKEA